MYFLNHLYPCTFWCVQERFTSKSTYFSVFSGVLVRNPLSVLFQVWGNDVGREGAQSLAQSLAVNESLQVRGAPGIQVHTIENQSIRSDTRTLTQA